MKNQESMRQILESALTEIRSKYGMALSTIDVEWTGTMAQPACAISRVVFHGASYPPIDWDGQ